MNPKSIVLASGLEIPNKLWTSSTFVNNPLYLDDTKDIPTQQWYSVMDNSPDAVALGDWSQLQIQKRPDELQTIYGSQAAELQQLPKRDILARLHCPRQVAPAVSVTVNAYPNQLRDTNPLHQNFTTSVYWTTNDTLTAKDIEKLVLMEYGCHEYSIAQARTPSIPTFKHYHVCIADKY